MSGGFAVRSSFPRVFRGEGAVYPVRLSAPLIGIRLATRPPFIERRVIQASGCAT